MDVASLGLCEELYKLSGWDGTYFVHFRFADGVSYEPIGGWSVRHCSTLPPKGEVAYHERPAYGLGYLLRKLPGKEEHDIFSGIGLLMVEGNKWGCRYRGGKGEGYIWGIADTPEDAATRLCIELFEQGILTKTN